MPLTVLIAPSGLKEALTPQVVADALATGVARAMPQARILISPMIDGGEGFTEALVAATGGVVHRLLVTGPLGEPVESYFGLLGGAGPRTAAVEVAAAAGLALVPADRRDLARTTSAGVGELIRAALDQGAERILLGCGDSGINDAGAGMAQALGVRLLDAQDREIGFGGGELARVARIDLSGRDPRLARVALVAAVNWHNVLVGKRGVTRVYASQKGATPAQVELLELAVESFAERILAATGIEVRHAPGTGASGGLGAAVLGLLGGELQDRYRLLVAYTKFDEYLRQADLVITAEGALDAKTPFGKVPGEVGRRAKALGVPVIALVGKVGEGSEVVTEHGIDAFDSIIKGPCTLEEALSLAEPLLVEAAEAAMRMVATGMRIGARRGVAGCGKGRK